MAHGVAGHGEVTAASPPVAVKPRARMRTDWSPRR
jgi:hypothetical protein